MKIFKFLTFLIVIFIFAFLFLNFTAVASFQPQFLVSWQAQNYGPSWYQGKIFPTKDSIIDVRFELIENNKIVDISNEKIRWYLNDDLIKNEENGLGIKSLKFLMSDYPGQVAEIKMQIFHYKGGEILDKIIKIFSVKPEVVIDSPFSDNKINTGHSVFRAWPFFFNVKNLNQLSIDWFALGQKVENIQGDPWQMNLNIGQETPKGTEIKLSVSVKNFLKNLEFANNDIKLQIK